MANKPLNHILLAGEPVSTYCLARDCLTATYLLDQGFTQYSNDLFVKQIQEIKNLYMSHQLSLKRSMQVIITMFKLIKCFPRAIWELIKNSLHLKLSQPDVSLKHEDIFEQINLRWNYIIEKFKVVVHYKEIFFKTIIYRLYVRKWKTNKKQY